MMGKWWKHENVVKTILNYPQNHHKIPQITRISLYKPSRMGWLMIALTKLLVKDSGWARSDIQNQRVSNASPGLLAPDL